MPVLEPDVERQVPRSGIQRDQRGDDEVRGRVAPHDFQCAVCKIIVTIQEKKWTDVSMDRIDNTRPHTRSNVQPVCQLHQVVAQHTTDVLTRAMLLHMTAVTVHSRVQNARTPAHVAALKAEHDRLRCDGAAKQACALCEIEVL